LHPLFFLSFIEFSMNFRGLEEILKYFLKKKELN
jgi:hypothetical protein